MMQPYAAGGAAHIAVAAHALGLTHVGAVHIKVRMHMQKNKRERTLAESKRKR